MTTSTLGVHAAAQQPSRAPQMLVRHFPEVAAGGFVHRDGTVAFYSRVNALVRPDTILLDFGAGRGAPHLEDPCEYRRRLLGFRGKVARVVGVDVDPAVLSNPSLDEAHVLEIGGPLPLSDASVDLVLADWVFEHLPDPKATAAEFERVLRPGGWICARTPNRWHYQYLAARVIPEALHGRVLGWVQPERREIDVFPKHYLANDVSVVRKLFPSRSFLNCTYTFQPPPAYLPQIRAIWSLGLLLDAMMPPMLRANLYIFAQKRVVG